MGNGCSQPDRMVYLARGSPCPDYCNRPPSEPCPTSATVDPTASPATSLPAHGSCCPGVGVLLPPGLRIRRAQLAICPLHPGFPVPAAFLQFFPSLSSFCLQSTQTSIEPQPNHVTIYSNHSLFASLRYTGAPV